MCLTKPLPPTPITTTRHSTIEGSPQMGRSRGHHGSQMPHSKSRGTFKFTAKPEPQLQSHTDETQATNISEKNLLKNEKHQRGNSRGFRGRNYTRNNVLEQGSARKGSCLNDGDNQTHTTIPIAAHSTPNEGTYIHTFRDDDAPTPSESRAMKRKLHTDGGQQRQLHKRARHEQEQTQLGSILKSVHDQIAQALEETSGSRQVVAKGIETTTKIMGKERKEHGGAEFENVPTELKRVRFKLDGLSGKTRDQEPKGYNQHGDTANPFPRSKTQTTSAPSPENGAQSMGHDVSYAGISNTKTSVKALTIEGVIASHSGDQIHSKTIRDADAVKVHKHVAPISLSKTSLDSDTVPIGAAKRTNKETGLAGWKFSKKIREANSDAALRKTLVERTAKIKQLMDDDTSVRVDYPEAGLQFFDYDMYSVPILYSKYIEHQYPYELANKPSNRLLNTLAEIGSKSLDCELTVLRRDALSLSEKRVLTSYDLGRQQAHKTEPTVFIDDCDLYLYADKVHVATERGLLLAADYIKLLGIPDTQPVRFNGTKPLWMKQAKENNERRRVLLSFSPESDLEAKGCIQIFTGSVVVVYERGTFDIAEDQEATMAYGIRLEDGVEGWFPYDATCRMDWLQDPDDISDSFPDSSIIDWAKFDYDSLIARVVAQQTAQQQSMQSWAQFTLLASTSSNIILPAYIPAPSAGSTFSQQGPISVASIPMATIPPLTHGTQDVICTEKVLGPTDLPSSSEDYISENTSKQSEQSYTDAASLFTVTASSISQPQSPHSQQDATALNRNDDELGDDISSEAIVTTQDHEFQESITVTTPEPLPNSLNLHHKVVPEVGKFSRDIEDEVIWSDEEI